MFLKMALYIPILYKIGKQIALINILIGTCIYSMFFLNFKNLFYQFYVGTYMIYSEGGTGEDWRIDPHLNFGNF